MSSSASPQNFHVSVCNDPLLYKSHLLNYVISLVIHDITQIETDVMVNAANVQLKRGGGVDLAIHMAAGPELQEMLDLIPTSLPNSDDLTKAKIKTGSCVMTSGFNSKAQGIIHAAGPIYRDHSANDSALLLRDTYTSALNMAISFCVNTITFPCISTGIYGFPSSIAADIMINTMLDVLWDNRDKHHISSIKICVLPKDQDNLFHVRRVMESVALNLTDEILNKGLNQGFSHIQKVLNPTNELTITTRCSYCNEISTNEDCNCKGIRLRNTVRDLLNAHKSFSVTEFYQCLEKLNTLIG